MKRGSAGAGHDLATVLQEVVENVELARRKLQLAAALRRFVTLEVELQADDSVDFLAAGRQHEDRHRVAGGAQALCDLQAGPRRAERQA